jgi:hypothetical protein
VISRRNSEWKDGSGTQMGERMIAMSTALNLASIKPSLDKLQAIESELAASLIERDEVIRASLVALLARQRLVVLGPPGTAKSALVTELANRISPQNGAGLRSFAYMFCIMVTAPGSLKTILNHASVVKVFIEWFFGIVSVNLEDQLTQIPVALEYRNQAKNRLIVVKPDGAKNSMK